MEDKWHPHARAGHSAASMRLDTHRSPCIIIFGGYNGRKSFNDVVILDNGKKQFKLSQTSIELSRDLISSAWKEYNKIECTVCSTFVDTSTGLS